MLELLDPGGRFVLKSRDAVDEEEEKEEAKREKGKKLNGEKKDVEGEAVGGGVGVRV